MRKQRRLALLLSLVAACIVVLATWVVPLRLRFGQGMNAYTLGYIQDEYAYLFESDTLVGGATTSNPYNGVGDEKVIGPRFLEPLIRLFLGLTGMSVLTFFWAWRFVFPVALLVLFVAAAQAALLRKRRPWSAALAISSGAAALSLLYFSYHLLCDGLFRNRYPDGYAPIFFWLNRVTSNIEFILSLLCLWLYLRFSEQPLPGRGCLLALAGALTLYLRPYAIVPLGMATAAGTLWMLWRRRIAPRHLFVLAGVLALLCVPWILISSHNGALPAYREMMARVFQPCPYQVHPCWQRHLIIAVLVLAAAVKVRASARTVLATGALSLMALPFVVALVKPAAFQLICLDDRFASYYLPLLLLAALLVLARWSEVWRGRAGPRRALGVTAALCSLACGAALCVAIASAEFEFSPNGWYHPSFVQRDLRYLKAYEWVREHTPSEALFLVDDGLDWSNVIGSSAEGVDRVPLNLICLHNDLFQLIARRRRVYSFHVQYQPLTDQQLNELLSLHCGTFGYTVERKRYLQALSKYRPQYVFWRKTPPVFLRDEQVPVPRGKLAAELQQSARTVYEDDVSVIWQLH